MAPSDATQAPPPSLTSSPYPYAAAPDVIRAHQKDAYFQGLLTGQISDLHRRLCGARSAHVWASETRTFADLLYLSLTTLLGNRTLGEEYCDLVQVEEPSIFLPFQGKSHPADATGTVTKTIESARPRLPSITRRAGYIATSILLPYIASRLLPPVRAAIRRRLQDRLARLVRQAKGSTTAVPSTSYRLQRYLLAHLSTLTSGAHFHAIALATFYFTGAYYSLSKRLFGLRYVFTRRIEEGQGGRAGYEVLGVLLVVQMVVRGCMHIRDQVLRAHPPDGEEAGLDSLIRERAFGAGGAGVNVSLDENAYSSNNELLPGGSQPGNGNQRSLVEIGISTHTPVPKGGRPRYDLGAGEGIMAWIKGRQQRKCTLCLEELKDPAATQCGHVFCWTCVGDWVREKPECPLCRRETLAQHVLPLRAL